MEKKSDRGGVGLGERSRSRHNGFATTGKETKDVSSI